MRPLFIVLRPSTELGLSLSVLSLSAAGIAWALPAPVWLKGVISIGIAWDLLRMLGRVAFLRGPKAIVAIYVTGEGKVRIETKNGLWFQCEFLPSSYVSSGLTILNVRMPDSRVARHVVLCRWNVDEAEFRRLRTWMRWGYRSWHSASGDENYAD